MQTDSPLKPEKVQPASPAGQEKKNPIFAVLGTVFGVVLLCILLTAVAGLGYWAYKLNTDLTTTRQQLAALQTDYDTLKSNNDKLTADYAQSQSDLEKTNGELKTTENSLKDSQDQNKTQRTKMDTARKKIAVIEAIFWNNEKDNVIESLVKAVNDSQLLTKWNKFKSSPTQSNAQDFADYLFGSAQDDLK
jgi:septal ring factor EnvC (AmiA/AmiB activator)